MNANDKDDIRTLLAMYCHALDFSDIDTFVGLFTPDGYFSSTADERFQGPDRLREFAVACGRHYAGHVRHWVLNSIIEGEGDEARVSSYMFSSRDAGTPEGVGQSPFGQFLSSGIYQDRVVRRAGGWLFAERTYRYDGDADITSRVGDRIVPGRLFA